MRFIINIILLIGIVLFEIGLIDFGGKSATKHLVEWVSKGNLETIRLRSQLILYESRIAISEAANNFVKYDEIIRVKTPSGNWEVVFSAPSQVGLETRITHLLFIP